MDETQANLAFVALRKEPFLMEELGHLAKEIQELHEVRENDYVRYYSQFSGVQIHGMDADSYHETDTGGLWRGERPLNPSHD